MKAKDHSGINIGAYVRQTLRFKLVRMYGDKIFKNVCVDVICHPGGLVLRQRSGKRQIKEIDICRREVLRFAKLIQVEYEDMGKMEKIESIERIKK